MAVKMKKGDQTVSVNESAVEIWKAKGFTMADEKQAEAAPKPTKNEPAATPEPLPPRYLNKSV